MTLDIASQMSLHKILVLDFGSQYSHLIVRRLREIGVYSELKRCDVPLSEIRDFGARGFILSGGPFSVYESSAPHVDPSFWKFVDENKLPVLGICYGLQEMMQVLGGKVEPGVAREFGFAELMVVAPSLSPSNGRGNGRKGDVPEPVNEEKDILLRDIPNQPTRVWMSHGDKVTALAPGFEVVAITDNSEFAVVRNLDKQMWGLQFHPEVSHTTDGTELLKKFVCDICQVRASWNMNAFAHTEVERLRMQIGQRHVVGALSGGVDSTVAAALLSQAIGSRFHGVLVDTGLLRKNEAQEVLERMRKHIPNLNIQCVDASEKFLSALSGVSDPEVKRKIIGRGFIEEFEKAVSRLGISIDETLLLQGTLYPDVIESVSFRGPSHTIKTHHNVGGLPENMKLQVLEPLRELFKDEVRQLGLELGISRESVWRHPFPGPGLAIRILGDITVERVKILREADAIYIDELRDAKIYDDIGQAFVVLLPEAMSVGVMGDCRTYEMTAVLRAVCTTDFMTADWYQFDPNILRKISSRIINEVKGINRVCYDVSSKPPATIEWE